MASKYLQAYPVPTGFPAILHEFTREVLRDQPHDLLAYAATYFEAKLNGTWREGMYPSQTNVPQKEVTNHLQHWVVPHSAQSPTSHHHFLEADDSKDYRDDLYERVVED
jgi:hypothetical protein